MTFERRTPTAARAVGVTVLHVLVLLPVGWYAVSRVWGDATWWLFLVNTFALYLFPLAALAACAALALRARSVASSAVLPLGLAIALYGGLFLPPRSPQSASLPTGSVELTVLTYNLNIHNENVDGIVEAIAAVDADVVALQELGSSMAAALVTRLAADYPYHVLDPSENWDGMGVLSRYPVQRVDVASASLVASGSLVATKPELMVLELPGRSVLLANVHNQSTPRYVKAWPAEITRAVQDRQAVAEMIVSLARTSQLPFIVAGDFNMTERSTAYRTITAVLDDAWREAGRGFGFTFPGGPRRPSPFGVSVPPWLLRIDFLFHSDGVHAVDAAMGPWDGRSDHRGLHATFVFDPDGT